MLLRYAFLVRGFVALVGVVATRLAAGTHYDVSPLTEVAVAFAAGTWVFAPGSWEQLFWLTLLPQLVIWPAFTVLSGITAGAAALWLAPESDPASTRGEAPADAPGSDVGSQRTLQLVSPRPEPQRRLPSEKVEQASPPVQSSSLEQVSHSPPLLPHELIGSASASSTPQIQRRFLIAPMSRPYLGLRGL